MEIPLPRKPLCVLLSVAAVLTAITSVGSHSPSHNKVAAQPPMSPDELSRNSPSNSTVEKTRLMIVVENRFNCSELGRKFPNATKAGLSPKLYLRSSRKFEYVSGKRTSISLSISLSLCLSLSFLPIVGTV